MSINIGGSKFTDITIDGSSVTEVTIDNSVVWSAMKTVDDFEDGDISEYAGDKSWYYVNSNSPVHSGTYSLKQDEHNEAISSTSGLANYPSQGDTFEVWVYDVDQEPWIQFDCQSESNSANCYEVGPRTRDNGLWIRRKDDSGNTNLVTKNVSLPTNEWLRVKIEWKTDGTIKPTIFDSSGNQLAQASTTDTTFTSGGIGFHSQHSNGGHNGICA